MNVILFCLVCLLGQILAGTNIYVAFLFTGAIAMGLYSVSIGGGVLSVAGLLNLILLGSFLLLAVLLKTAVFEGSDKNLLAPETTATVMFLGFTGVLIGTWTQCRLPVLRSPLIAGIREPRMYLALTVVFLVFGYGGYVIGIGPELSGAGIQTGGILGIARNFSGFRSFAIVPALYFAWASGGSRFMTHPLPLGVLAFGIVTGIFSTGKQEAMEPLVFFLVVCACRYGIRDKKVWGLVLAGLSYYTLIIYPYSQYVRFNGGRQGDFATRLVAIEEIFWRTLTDPEFRTLERTNSIEVKPTYLGRPVLEPFSRFAMVGEADRLIAGTKEQQAFSGWKTITWGFKLMLPSFIYPEKPIFGSANFLGHIAGDAPADDETTQWAYGLMASLYNAFAYRGVLIGCSIFFAVFYYTFRFWFGDLRWTSLSTGSTIWFLLIVTGNQHGLVEGDIAGLEGFIITPCLIMILYQSAKLLCPFLPNKSRLKQLKPSPVFAA